MYQTKFFQDVKNKSEHFEENILHNGNYHEALDSWKPTKDIKETFKELTQQLNHEIDLCKKALQKDLEKKGKVDLIPKTLLFLPGIRIVI